MNNEKMRNRPGAEGGSVEAALRVILKRFGVDAEFLAEGDSLEDIFDRVLSPLGVMYEFTELERGWPHRAFDYMVGFTAEGEAVALLPVVGGYRCVFQDGRCCRASGKGGGVGPVAICIHRPFPDRSFTVKGFITWMLTLFSVRDILPVAAAAAIIALLGMVVPAVYNLVLGSIASMGGKGMETLWFFAWFFIAAGIASAVVKAARALVLGALTVRVTGEAQTAIVARILLLPDSFFRDNTAGRLSTRIADGRRLASILVSVVVDTSFTALFSLVYLPQMFRYAPELVAPALLVLLAGVAVSLVTGFAGIRKERRSIAAVTELHSFVYASLRGIQKIKNTGAQDRAFDQWEGLYGEKMQQMYNPSLLVMIGDLIQSAITAGGMVFLLAIAGRTGVTPAAWIAFYAAFTMTASGLSTFLNVVNSMMLISPLAEQLGPIFSAEPERSGAFGEVTALKGAVAVEDLTFRYEPEAPLVLDGVSFSVEPGEFLGIVGESGCGKSTLLRLLMGFEHPEGGMIRYDGTPMDRLNPRSLRRHFGVVLQNSRIMPGTIYDNIAFNSPWLTEDAAWDAAEKAGIADFVRSLDLGMDTILSEASGGISGGQKQAILLARAIAAGPDMILLDEATSAMDNLTQKKVLDILAAMPVTRVIVAQRLSTVAACDRILVIADGRIAQQGTYGELLGEKGPFGEMARRQSV